ncbi:GMC family oxidoreductase [Congregibacter brevis]|uniref:GMC family oxidoreductase n=1 Tax=Congregibacter brevis TaxID=3081201 RepID=A0ABZ0IGH2_9GAMM|nr:GMC family oxidoreductase [Congregibacter sp. IMCC45268]
MQSSTEFDAIVIGSGITGGWAAKELTERGLKVLVLERGRDLQHGSGYLGEHAPSWKMTFNGRADREELAKDYEVQSHCYAMSQANKQFWNVDSEHPYALDESKPFDWIRGDVVGGRSLMWGRQTYRLSEQDFNANAKDGHGIPWPVGYEDIAPWYSYVEKFIGVNGRRENLPQLPDGEFQKPMPWMALEETISDRLKTAAPDVTLTNSRSAILTEPLPGRSACHYCGPCERGCSTGSYFSSQSSTLPAARATGNLTLVSDAIVERLEYDQSAERISSVYVVDRNTRTRKKYSAKVFFLCASTVGSTQLLLNSKSESFPNGLGNKSGTLGHYLMDHSFGVSGLGVFFDHLDSYYYGNRPTGLYIPRFRNLDGADDQDTDFLRGYGFQTGTLRADWRFQHNRPGFGEGYKEALRKPGYWLFALIGFAETLPVKRNRMYLSRNKVDRYGIPQVVFDYEWQENDYKLRQDANKQAKRILNSAGAAIVTEGSDDLSTPGLGIHEMGTARMGDDPNQSVLNKHNQAHGIPNLFVTDGSFMASSSCVNPSLTYMAFTARACAYATELLASGDL